jgi:hypothetical protein
MAPLWMSHSLSLFLFIALLAFYHASSLIVSPLNMTIGLV